MTNADAIGKKGTSETHNILLNNKTKREVQTYVHFTKILFNDIRLG